MFNKINHIFDFNQNALNIYARRQEILASNIANSDTPGYKSIDINFKNEIKKILQKEKIKNMIFSLQKTSINHLDAQKNNDSFSIKTIPVIVDQNKLNTNTVDMNRERIQILNNNLKFQSSLSFIKNEIRNIMLVLEG